MTSYEFYKSSDSARELTVNAVVDFLVAIRDGRIESQGGRSMMQRGRRILYEVSTNVHEMFSNQPLLTCCLFGVPLGFLAIICYSICSTDFTVDRDDVYPDSENEQFTGLFFVLLTNKLADTEGEHEKAE